LVDSTKSNVGFIRLFGGGAGQALDSRRSDPLRAWCSEGTKPSADDDKAESAARVRGSNFAGKLTESACDRRFARA